MSKDKFISAYFRARKEAIVLLFLKYFRKMRSFENWRIPPD